MGGLLLDSEETGVDQVLLVVRHDAADGLLGLELGVLAQLFAQSVTSNRVVGLDVFHNQESLRRELLVFSQVLLEHKLVAVALSRLGGLSAGAAVFSAAVFSPVVCSVSVAATFAFAMMILLKRLGFR